MSVRIGVDTGGTFTDVVLYDAATNAVYTTKTPSTPGAFDEGVLNGIDTILAETGVDPARVSYLSHGTTVGTNAVLEGEFPDLGLITNEGLRDVLKIGDQTRPSLYDLQAETPPSLVDRRHRYGVPGRIGADGAVVDELDEAALELAEKLASGPPLAMEFTKEAMHAGRDDTDAGLEVEAFAFGHLITTDDVIEGVTKLQSDEDPQFEGN